MGKLDGAEPMSENSVSTPQIRLEDAADWLILYGDAIYRDEGRKPIWRRLVDFWFVQLWVEPRVLDGRYLALFRIKSNGIYFDVLKFAEFEKDGFLHSMWAYKIHSEEWAGQKNTSIFVLTRRAGEQSEIVMKDASFSTFESTLPSEVLSRIVSDNRTVYDLEPWNFQTNYAGSSIPSARIIARDGKYIRE